MTDELDYDLIRRLQARRGSKLVWAGGKWMAIHTDGERTVELPSGLRARIVTKAGGIVTQVEEGGRIHAFVRPKSFKVR